MSFQRVDSGAMRAFVIGNAALDETVLVAGLPAPGASIHGRMLAQDLGGKGVNQAIVLGRAGVTCCLGAALGADARASEIRARLGAEPVEARLLEVPGGVSDFSVILMAEAGENTIITTNAAALSLDAGAAVGMLGGACRGDLLVMQGNLSAATTLAVLQKGHALGMRIAFNPSPLGAFHGAIWPLLDMVFVNEGEAAALGGADALLAAGVGQVVLTLGAEGARLISEIGSEDVPAMPAKMVDTTGAGDCFMAVALASAALRGVGLDVRALRHGAAAASIAVSHPGTVGAFPSATEIAAILSR
jgi:ribokinase